MFESGSQSRAALDLIAASVWGHAMRHSRRLCAQLLVFVCALGVFAVNAAACEGGGGAEPTSLSTKLSGGGSEREELAVSEGTKVKDKATLTGTNASKATGKVAYKIYSEKNCATLVKAAGEVAVSGESVPASSEEELAAGKVYYWRAHYGGDANNAESTSPCTEILDVVKCSSTSSYCEPTITPGVKLTAVGAKKNCTAGPIMIKGAERFLLTAGHCFGKKNENTETIKEKVQSAYPTEEFTERKIGETVTFTNSKKYDVAEVKIENTEWLLTGGGVPPVLVEWAETPALKYVTGTAKNSAGEPTCHTGITSDLVCGKILRTSVTEGTENLAEANGVGQEGDSGGPEFVRNGGVVEIQGIEVAGGAGFSREGTGSLMNASDKITGIPQGAEICRNVTEMKLRWTDAPIEGTGIPDETDVLKCEEVGANATIEMSAKATTTGKENFDLGYKALFYFEPISKIKEVYPEQTLLVK